jgi:hypothetical protein
MLPVRPLLDVDYDGADYLVLVPARQLRNISVKKVNIPSKIKPRSIIIFILFPLEDDNGSGFDLARYVYFFHTDISQLARRN